MTEYRVLTIHQPWASLLVSGEKPVENRTRRPPANLIGSWIAIHASARAPAPLDGQFGHTQAASLPRGAIIGLGKLWGWFSISKFGVNSCRISTYEIEKIRESPHFSGPVGLVFREMVGLEKPVPYKGRQGWPRVKQEEEQLIQLLDGVRQLRLF